MTRRVLLVVSLVTLFGAGPTDAEPRRAAGPIKLADTRILFFPPNVEVYEIGAAQPVLKPDWTEAAREHVRQALEGELAGRKTTLVPYQEPEDTERRSRYGQVVKVHTLVSRAILVHDYGGDALRLPSKQGRFEWSVGPGASVLREDHGDADYALFIGFVEGHASGGRVAMNVVGAALGGPIVTGQQTGNASLVDLRTGDVVWFNRHIERGGDLRTAANALKAVQRLLKELPF